MESPGDLADWALPGFCEFSVSGGRASLCAQLAPPWLDRGRRGRTGKFVGVSGIYVSTCCGAQRGTLAGATQPTCPTCGKSADWKLVLSPTDGDSQEVPSLAEVQPGIVALLGLASAAPFFLVTIQTPPGQHVPRMREDREVALTHPVNAEALHALQAWIVEQRRAGELRYHYEIEIED